MIAVGIPIATSVARAHYRKSIITRHVHVDVNIFYTCVYSAGKIRIRFRKKY